MASIHKISADKLLRLIGTAHCPGLLDLRSDAEYAAGQLLIPGSMRRAHSNVQQSAEDYAGRSVIMICASAAGVSQGAAAWLRQAGVKAEYLEGGFEGWRKAGHPLVNAAKIPPADRLGRTIWVTRERPKVERIACPWLIRRFVDPGAIFLFAAPEDAGNVAEHYAATPFDIEDAFWGHRGTLCTFDIMLEEFGLATEPLLRLAKIIRAADMDQLDTSPQAAGLLAVSLGLSRIYSDDNAQLEAGFLIYDALYRWCRDATHETHTQHSKKRRP